MIRRTNSKLTLEQRIARLERLLKNEEKDPADMTPSERNAWAKQHMADIRKNYKPSRLSSRDVITNWFDDTFGPENFDSKRAWMRALKYLADRADDISVTDCADETGEDYDEITDKLSELAKDAISDINYNKIHGSDVVASVWTDPWQ